VAIGEMTEDRRADEDAEQRRGADPAGRYGVEMKPRSQRNERETDAAQDVPVDEDAGVGVRKDLPVLRLQVA